jgi:hypothetical protein
MKPAPFPPYDRAAFAACFAGLALGPGLIALFVILITR